ncbi:hypothetical protein PFISCL1PPCAC_1247, partial [Pristionchus fissidentatus]
LDRSSSTTVHALLLELPYTMIAGKVVLVMNVITCVGVLGTLASVFLGGFVWLFYGCWCLSYIITGIIGVIYKNICCLMAHNVLLIIDIVVKITIAGLLFFMISALNSVEVQKRLVEESGRTMKEVTE